MSDESALEGLSDQERRLDRLRQRLGLWLGPAAFVLVLLSPLGLEPSAQRLAAVLALVMVYWISEALPLPVTAFLGPALATLLGVGRARDVFAPFGDPVIFLFIGSFLLAEALSVHGLDRRIALHLLSLPGVARSPSRIRWVMGLAAAGISAWMSNTATAAMMVPIALGLVRALRAAGSPEPARATLLVMGISASLGGLATPVGTPPNLIVLGFLERSGGSPVSFLTFMLLGVPISLALLATMLLVVGWMIPPAPRGLDLSGHFAAERASVPVWGSGQTACAAAFGLAVLLWIGPSLAEAAGWVSTSQRLEESVVALLAAGLLFLWPVGERTALTWKEGRRIDWGTLLLFGGGLSLGKMMFDTGLAERLAKATVAVTGVDSLWGLTALVLAASILLTEATSNTAAATMLAPLVLALASGLGVASVPPLLAVAFGASMGFMFPISTPPNAIVYGTGLVPITSMMRIGVVVDLLSFFVIFAGLRILCPLLGLA
ncbi:MAG TPA: SLC13 family permease [Vicinamibacteria bacterium]|nr:SLC13 family permease [Vicinamibacteria bacterium]